MLYHIGIHRLVSTFPFPTPSIFASALKKKIRMTARLQLLFMTDVGGGNCVRNDHTFALPRDIVKKLNVTWKTAKKNTKICS